MKVKEKSKKLAMYEAQLEGVIDNMTRCTKEFETTNKKRCKAYEFLLACGRDYIFQRVFKP